MYSLVEAKFWDDEKIRAIKEDAPKCLFLYILTNKNRNVFGCYTLTLETIRGDLYWSKSKVEKNLKKLEELDFIEYDEQNKMVLIKNYLKYNPIEGDNQIKGAISKLKEVSKSYLWRHVYNAIKSAKKNTQTLMAELAQLIPPDASMALTTETVSEVAQEDTQENLIRPFERSNSNSNNNIEEHITISSSSMSRPPQELEPEQSLEDDDHLIRSFTGDTYHEDFTGSIKRKWEKCFGKSPTPSQLESIYRKAALCNMDVKLVEKAVEAGADNSTTNPLQYILTLIKDWFDSDIVTTDDLEERNKAYLAKQSEDRFKYVI